MLINKISSLVFILQKYNIFIRLSIKTAIMLKARRIGCGLML
jgi:hypothetical protein